MSITVGERCPLSDLPVDGCACVHCEPDANVIELQDATPHADHHAPVDGVPVEVSASPDFGPRPLSRTLRQSVDLYATLGDLLGGHRTGPDSEGGKTASDGPPLPLREQVAEHRHQLVHDLRWWVGRVAAAYDRTVTLTGDGSEREVVRVPRLDSGVTACARFLNNAQWLHTHDDGAVLVDVLRGWNHRAHVLTDLPKLRARLPLRTCYTRDLTACAGVAHALVPADRGELVVVECDTCRSRWDVARLPEAAGVWVGQADAARLVGVQLKTLNKWVSRGQLDVDGRNRVSLDAILSRISAENLVAGA